MQPWNIPSFKGHIVWKIHTAAYLFLVFESKYLYQLKSTQSLLQCPKPENVIQWAVQIYTILYCNITDRDIKVLIYISTQFKIFAVFAEVCIIEGCNTYF